MRIHLYSPKYFEKWDYYSPSSIGIGGSETAHIETAIRLAQYHDVISYSPLPDHNEPILNYNVCWFDLNDANFNDDALWIIYRSPKIAEYIKSGKVWIICQDIDYPDEWTTEALNNIQYIFALCEDHYFYLKNKYPHFSDKLRITSNGIKVELLNDYTFIIRNPKRIMYASSPDRGLITLINIFKRAHEIDDELELTVCYGFDNIEKTIEKFPSNKSFLDKLRKELDHPKINHIGRIPQGKLYEEWFKTGLWVYPTNFHETNCITSMEAQACGAIPICSDLWALRDKVKFGSIIQGNTDDKLVQARYVMEILKYTSSPILQNQIRLKMMEYAKEAYGWNGHVIKPWLDLIKRDYGK